ncbi:MAG: phosphoesterase [Gammaproteobacteria bacterium]|nr:phosphoesterase [Gammaproteobacteria bacterium]
MARSFGLKWMVSTDHGGPNHSRIRHDVAYPVLLESRQQVPEVLQFFGMELDAPAGDHGSLIIPRSDGERAQLRDIEFGFSRKDVFPPDPARDQPERMIGALNFMRAQALPPLLIANHPSRSAKAGQAYGRFDPAEFRDWNDAAPQVAVGMEGSPGHQASTLDASGAVDADGRRGGYNKGPPTMGGFDPTTARLGGLWDSMLGEGRGWWITASSDSHYNWREGGDDFWPGEYSKTYVYARTEYADILDGIRHGRVFVTTGDLVSEVDVTVSGSRSRKNKAQIGGLLTLARGEDLIVEIRIRDPAGPNAAGRKPAVARVDVIVGELGGPVASRADDRNPTAHVDRRFTAAKWKRKGEVLTMRHVIHRPRHDLYVRIRGTSTDELEPLPDARAEDPWSDLWFYTNPTRVSLRR